MDDREKIVLYLQKSHSIIERLTETNKIITAKNKELFLKNIYLQYKNKLILIENQKLKENYIPEKYRINHIDNQDDFEIVE